MTPAARVQAAIELVDLLIAAARPDGPAAERLFTAFFAGRRYAGGGDRRAIRELAWCAVRCCGPLPPSGRAAMLRLTAGDAELAARFDGSAHAPAPIAAGEPVAAGGIAPDWLTAALAASDIAGAAAEALLTRASLDVRVNALKADRAAIALPFAGEPLAVPQGLRFPVGTPVERWAAFGDGLLEVQDLGSQLACAAVAARAGELAIDLCAGAGGKTLALAAAMGNRGTLVAADTDRMRLRRLAQRAARAGAETTAVLLNPGAELAALHAWRGQADAVLVDAPCSGSGTWRRHPELRWRLRPGDLDRLATLQARLLDLGAALVRPGGRLVFVTCSLLDAEGADQVAAFAARHPGWRMDPPGFGTPRGGGVRLEPLRDGTDGFFVARLIAP